MDRNAPSTYVESTASSLIDPRSVIDHIASLKKPTVCPVIIYSISSCCCLNMFSRLLCYSPLNKDHYASIRADMHAGADAWIIGARQRARHDDTVAHL